MFCNNIILVKSKYLRIINKHPQRKKYSPFYFPKIGQRSHIFGILFYVGLLEVV